MTHSFPGFPADLFEFLNGLVSNNERPWFKANKERYTAHVVAPVTEFITAMGERLGKISACFVADPRPQGGSMFRIYRDTRFSADKRPYKEHVGCQFRHYRGRDVHAPCFYVHLEPSRVFFGGGVWKPSPTSLQDIRNAIADDPVRWKDITRNKSFVKRFVGLDGESLKRPPRGFDPDHPCIDDIKRKSFVVFQTVDPSLALTPKFITEVERAFTAAGPFVAFLTEAMGLPYEERV